MPIGDSKVEQTSGINVLLLDETFGDTRGKLVDFLNGVQERLSHCGGIEAFFRRRTRIDTQSLQTIQEEGESPFTVGTTLDGEVPLVMQLLAQSALDVFPASKTAIMHPHEAAVGEGVAIVLAQRTLGSSANMGEYESRGRLRSQAMQIGAVPGGNDGCE